VSVDAGQGSRSKQFPAFAFRMDGTFPQLEALLAYQKDLKKILGWKEFLIGHCAFQPISQAVPIQRDRALAATTLECSYFKTVLTFGGRLTRSSLREKPIYQEPPTAHGHSKRPSWFRRIIHSVKCTVVQYGFGSHL
jgi:hypothetical protein